MQVVQQDYTWLADDRQWHEPEMVEPDDFSLDTIGVMRSFVTSVN